MLVSPLFIIIKNIKSSISENKYAISRLNLFVD
nr:MAG TPA: hypothetical protein [Caudoviricetes sp.]